MLGLASLKTPASTPAVRTPPQRVAVCRAASREAGEAGVTGDGGDKEMRGPSLARRSVLAAGAALFPSVVCPVCNPAKAEVWGYGYENGPPRWRGFCVEGVNQSPIDIRTALLRTPVTQDPPKIITKYQATKASCINTGHGTMQVNFPPGSNSMVVGDTQYDLLQFHFHSPSEHAFDERRTEMEAHLVHRRRGSKNDLAVLGVMLSAGSNLKKNRALSAALNSAPFLVNTKVECQVDPADLLPPGGVNKTEIITYQGSLTTPPCSEGVRWLVCKREGYASADQVLAFQRYVAKGDSLGVNARPLIEINPNHEVEVWPAPKKA